MLEVKNISKYYGSKMAIENISFSAARGQIIGLVGHNGSGKTTTMSIITNCLAPDGGSVMVDGVSAQTDPVKLRSKIGYLPEIPPVYTDMTVNEQLSFACGLKGLPRGEYEGQIAAACEKLNITGVRGRLIKNLSKGYRQRVGFAQALIGDPPLLILDEPAAGLDPRGRERILGMLQELHREGGVTIVMVSHSMDDCARLATRMIVMSKGELVLTDTPRNIFRQADLMRSIGLGVPEAAELCGRLRAAGLQLPDDLFTQEELHDHLLRLWKEKQEKEAAK